MAKNLITEEEKQKVSEYFVPSKRSGKNLIYTGPEEERKRWFQVRYQEQNNKRRKQWSIDNKEREAKRNETQGRIYRWDIKVKALQNISGLEVPKCNKCPIDDIRLLTINHLTGNGRKDQELHGGTSKMYSKIAKNEYPDISNLEVCCYHCNILYEYEVGRRKLP